VIAKRRVRRQVQFPPFKVLATERHLLAVPQFADGALQADAAAFFPFEFGGNRRIYCSGWNAHGHSGFFRPHDEGGRRRAAPFVPQPILDRVLQFFFCAAADAKRGEDRSLDLAGRDVLFAEDVPVVGLNTPQGSRLLQYALVFADGLERFGFRRCGHGTGKWTPVFRESGLLGTGRRR